MSADLRNRLCRDLYAAEVQAITKSGNTLEIARLRAVRALLAIDLRDISVQAASEEFERHGDDLLAVADAVDPLIEAFGAMAKQNSHAISERELRGHFSRPIFNALDGNGLFLIENACAQARENETVEA